MAQKQTPGTFDRIFNPTFGFLQQPLWRKARAMKRKDISLLSKKGLLDPALLPILGVLFSPENAVMPDELFGEDLGAQITGAIATDPLVYASGGISSIGAMGRSLARGFTGGASRRVGRAAARKAEGAVIREFGEETTKQVRKIADLKATGTKEALAEAAELEGKMTASELSVLDKIQEGKKAALQQYDKSHVASTHRAAHFAGKNMDEVADLKSTGLDAQEALMRATTADDYVKSLDHGLANRGWLDDAGKHIGDELTEAEIKHLGKLRNTFKGANKETLDKSLHEIMGKQFDRKMGLSLPLLGDLANMYIPISTKVMKDQKGWMKWYFGTVKNIYKGLALPVTLPAKLFDKQLARVPIVGKVSEGTKQFLNHLSLGIKVGPSGRMRAASAALRNVHAEDANQSHMVGAAYVTPEAGALANLVMGDGGGLMSVSREGSRELSGRFMVSLQGGADEAGETVLKHFNTVSTSEQRSLVAFDKLTRLDDAGKPVLSEIDQIKGLEDAMEGFTDQYRAAQWELATLNKNAIPNMAWDELGKGVKASFAFKTGKSLSKGWTSVFQTSTGVSDLQKASGYLNRLRATSSASSHAVGRIFARQVHKTAKEMGYSKDLVNQVHAAAVGLAGSEDEVRILLSAMNGHGKPLSQVVKELDEFAGGRVHSFLHYLAATTSEGAELSGKNLDMFEDMLGKLGVNKRLKLNATDPKLVAALEQGGAEADEIRKLLDNVSELPAAQKKEIFDKFGIQEYYLHQTQNMDDVLLETTGRFYGEADFAMDAKSMGLPSERSGEAVVQYSRPTGDPRNFTFSSNIDKSRNQALVRYNRDELFGEGGMLAKLTNKAAAIRKYRDAAPGKGSPKIKEYLDNNVQGSVTEGLFQVESDMIALKNLANQEAIFGQSMSQIDSASLIPTYEKSVLNLGVSSEGVGFQLGVRQPGMVFGETAEDITEFALTFQKLQYQLASIKRHVQLMGPADELTNMSRTLPQTFIDDLEKSMSELRGLVEEAAYAPLGPEGRVLAQMHTSFRNSVLKESMKHGIHGDTVPLGYIHVARTGEQAKVIRTMLNDIELPAGTTIPHKIQGFMDKRGGRKMTYLDFNDIKEWTLRMAKTDATEDLTAELARYEEALLGQRAKEFAENPFAAAVAQYGQLNSVLNSTKWRESVFRPGGVFEKNGGLIGFVRRVIPLDDSGQRRALPYKQITTSIEDVPGAPLVARTTTEATPEAATSVDTLAGLPVSRLGGNDVAFDTLLPKNFWVLDDHGAKYAGSDSARETLRGLYTNGYLNAGGVLMIREAFKNNTNVFNRISRINVEEFGGLGRRVDPLTAPVKPKPVQRDLFDVGQPAPRSAKGGTVPPGGAAGGVTQDGTTFGKPLGEVPTPPPPTRDPKGGLFDADTPGLKSTGGQEGQKMVTHEVSTQGGPIRLTSDLDLPEGILARDINLVNETSAKIAELERRMLDAGKGSEYKNLRGHLIQENAKLQDAQANILLGHLGMAAVEGLAETRLVRDAHFALLDDLGEDQLAAWLTKHFDLNADDAGRAAVDGDSFMNAVVTSAIRQKGLEGMREAGLGKFVDAVKKNVSKMIDTVIKAFTKGRNLKNLDLERHAAVADELRALARTALNLEGDTAATVARNSQARKNVADFYWNSVKRQSKSIFQDLKQELGMTDAAAYEWYSNQAYKRAQVTKNATDLLRVGGAQQITKAANAYLTQLRHIENDVIKELALLDDIETLPLFTRGQQTEAQRLERLVDPSEDLPRYRETVDGVEIDDMQQGVAVRPPLDADAKVYKLRGTTPGGAPDDIKYEMASGGESSFLEFLHKRGMMERSAIFGRPDVSKHELDAFKIDWKNIPPQDKRDLLRLVYGRDAKVKYQKGQRTRDIDPKKGGGRETVVDSSFKEGYVIKSSEGKSAFIGDDLAEWVPHQTRWSSGEAANIERSILEDGATIEEVVYRTGLSDARVGELRKSYGSVVKGKDDASVIMDEHKLYQPNHYWSKQKEWDEKIGKAVDLRKGYTDPRDIAAADKSIDAYKAESAEMWAELDKGLNAAQQQYKAKLLDKWRENNTDLLKRQEKLLDAQIKLLDDDAMFARTMLHEQLAGGNVPLNDLQRLAGATSKRGDAMHMSPEEVRRFHTRLYNSKANPSNLGAVDVTPYNVNQQAVLRFIENRGYDVEKMLKEGDVAGLRGIRDDVLKEYHNTPPSSMMTTGKIGSGNTKMMDDINPDDFPFWRSQTSREGSSFGSRSVTDFRLDPGKLDEFMLGALPKRYGKQGSIKPAQQVTKKEQYLLDQVSAKWGDIKNMQSEHGLLSVLDGPSLAKAKAAKRLELEDLKTRTLEKRSALSNKDLSYDDYHRLASSGRKLEKGADMDIHHPSNVASVLDEGRAMRSLAESDPGQYARIITASEMGKVVPGVAKAQQAARGRLAKSVEAHSKSTGLVDRSVARLDDVKAEKAYNDKIAELRNEANDRATSNMRSNPELTPPSIEAREFATTAAESVQARGPIKIAAAETRETAAAKSRLHARQGDTPPTSPFAKGGTTSDEAKAAQIAQSRNQPTLTEQLAVGDNVVDDAPLHPAGSKMVREDTAEPISRNGFYLEMEHPTTGDIRYVGGDSIDLGMTVQSLGRGPDLKSATRDFFKTGRAEVSPTLDRGAQFREAKLLEGHQVAVGPKGFNAHVSSELAETPSSQAGMLRAYDSVHGVTKLAVTTLGFPLSFHTANMVGAYSQGIMHHIGPRHMMMGMATTIRMIAPNTKGAVKFEQEFNGAMQVGAKGTHKSVPGIYSYAEKGASGGGRGGRLGLRQTVQESEQLAGVASPAGVARIGGEDIASKPAIDQLYFRDSLGRAHDLGDVFRTAGMEGLFNTMVREDAFAMSSGTSAVWDTMSKAIIKDGLISESLSNVSAFAESSELFVRVSGLIGGLNAGMDVRTAAKMTREAMIDYADITNFERNVLKRASFFYTYPRKMIPKSMKFLMENPGETALAINGAAKPLSNSDKMTWAEGRPELVIGDHRVNLARMVAQVDATVAVGALGDMIAPGLKHTRAITGEAPLDQPMGPAAALQAGGWKSFFPTEDPLHVDNKHWLTESARANWALTLMTGGKLINSNDPEVEYSPLEQVARAVLPFRKVRTGQEEGRQIRRINMYMQDYKREFKRAEVEGDLMAIQVLEGQMAKMEDATKVLRKQQNDKLKAAGKDLNYG